MVWTVTAIAFTPVNAMFVVLVKCPFFEIGGFAVFVNKFSFPSSPRRKMLDEFHIAERSTECRQSGCVSWEIFYRRDAERAEMGVLNDCVSRSPRRLVNSEAASWD